MLEGSGNELWVNQKIHSPSGRYSVVLQPDCNLVVYRNAVPRDNNFRAVWASGTQRPNIRGLDGPYDPSKVQLKLALCSDGNLVIYHDYQVDEHHVQNDVLWAASTSSSSKQSAWVLRMCEDGNLKIFTSTDQVVWSTTPNQPPLPNPDDDCVRVHARHDHQYDRNTFQIPLDRLYVTHRTQRWTGIATHMCTERSGLIRDTHDQVTAVWVEATAQPRRSGFDPRPSLGVDLIVTTRPGQRVYYPPAPIRPPPPVAPPRDMRPVRPNEDWRCTNCGGVIGRCEGVKRRGDVCRWRNLYDPFGNIPCPLGCGTTFYFAEHTHLF